MTALVTRIRSSRRSSALAVGALIVVVAAAAWFGVVSPKRSHASKLKGDVTTAQADLATATHAAAAANKQAAEAALTALPGNSDQPGILDNLNSLGKKSGVTVATVTPDLTTVTPNAVSLSVIVNGKYFQIANFLHTLRTQVRVGRGGHVVASGRLFDVQSVQLAQGAATMTPGQLAATITVNASIFTPVTAGTTSVGASAGTSTDTSTSATGSTVVPN